MNSYYAATLLVYAGVDIIACIALNLQFGVSGIVNFSFIVFQSIGAYTAAVLSMPPDTANGAYQVYIGGFQLPFPIPWIGGAIVGGLLAIPVGLVVLRKLRSDYQAISLLVLSVIANSVIMNARTFLNGAAGIAQVPGPFADQVDPLSQTYQLLYVGLTIPCVLLVWLVASRIVNSPFGRSLRAMREHELAATAIGKNPVQLKMTIFIVGGVIAGLLRGDPCGLHRRVGAVGMALPRDDHPFRRGHRRWARQQRRRDAWCAPRARGFLRGDPADTRENRRLDTAAQSDPRHGVGGDRPAHHRVPVVPARGRQARASPRVRWQSPRGRGRSCPRHLISRCWSRATCTVTSRACAR